MKKVNIENYNQEVGENILSQNFVDKIKEYLKKNGMEKIKIEVTTGSQKGDNFCGTIAKVNVKATDKEANKKSFNWITKSAPNKDSTRKTIKAEVMYTREIYVYEILLPIFKNFQKDKKVLKPFESYAKYVLSHIDTNQEHLIMDDMKSMGYILKDKREPLDYEHVKLVLRSYAKLHALSYAIRDQRPALFQKIAMDTKDKYFSKKEVDEITIRKFQENYRSQVSACLDQEKDAKTLKLLDLFAKNAIDVVYETIARVTKHSVVIHGDSWVNNMLFKYNDESKPNFPSNVCLLDWQMSRLGSPVFDLSYFIYTCTDKNLRDEKYNDMIIHYYDTLCEHLNNLGSDPQRLLTFDELDVELRRCSIVGLYMSTVVLRLMLTENEKVMEWSKSENYDAMLEAMRFEDVEEEIYKRRTRDVIVDFAGRGYFDFLKDVEVY